MVETQVDPVFVEFLHHCPFAGTGQFSDYIIPDIEGVGVKNAGLPVKVRLPEGPAGRVEMGISRREEAGKEGADVIRIRLPFFDVFVHVIPQINELPVQSCRVPPLADCFRIEVKMAGEETQDYTYNEKTGMTGVIYDPKPCRK